MEARSEEDKEWLPATGGPQIYFFLDDESTDTWNALDANDVVIGPDQSLRHVAGNGLRDAVQRAHPY